MSDDRIEWVTITDPPPAVVPVGRSLWQRIPDWALAVGTIVLLVLLALPLVLS